MIAGGFALATLVAPAGSPGAQELDPRPVASETPASPEIAVSAVVSSALRATPLVLVFDDGDPLEGLVTRDFGGDSFDLDGRGGCDRSDWPGPHTPWLALDRDLNGHIDSGAELFGSGTLLAGGRHARHGFEALAALDADGDGRLSAHDPAFASLLLWSDLDADRRSTALEAPPAAATGVVSISLSYARAPRCDARGNCEIEQARFAYLDRGGELRTGRVVDLHLACR